MLGGPIGFLLRKAGTGLYFCNLLIVPHVVQWNVNQPLVSAKRAEDRERMLRSVLFERDLGFLGELPRLGAPDLVSLDHFLVSEFSMRHNRLGRLCFVAAIDHRLFKKLGFAAGLASQSGFGGAATARCTPAKSPASARTICSAVSPTDQRSGPGL
jgi:hypothetical protein